MAAKSVVIPTKAGIDLFLFDRRDNIYTIIPRKDPL
jgi:hypothetical protein